MGRSCSLLLTFLRLIYLFNYSQDADEKHHVVKMHDHFYFRNHLCIAMELMSINLYELIKANGFVGFSTSLIRRFTTQMLHSLILMRHHRIVHCDLKPEVNLYFTSQSDIIHIFLSRISF